MPIAAKRKMGFLAPRVKHVVTQVTHVDILPRDHSVAPVAEWWVEIGTRTTVLMTARGPTLSGREAGLRLRKIQQPNNFGAHDFSIVVTAVIFISCPSSTNLFIEPTAVTAVVNPVREMRVTLWVPHAGLSMRSAEIRHCQHALSLATAILPFRPADRRVGWSFASTAF